MVGDKRVKYIEIKRDRRLRNNSRKGVERLSMYCIYIYISIYSDHTFCHYTLSLTQISVNLYNVCCIGILVNRILKWFKPYLSMISRTSANVFLFVFRSNIILDRRQKVCWSRFYTCWWRIVSRTVHNMVSHVVSIHTHNIRIINRHRSAYT